MQFLFDDKIEKKLEELLDLNLRWQAYFVFASLFLMVITFIGLLVSIFLF
jgi:hypothetical protein